MEAQDIVNRLIFFIPFLISLTVHEWAHAWAAWKLGDDTAKLMGRLTLNPLAHIDPVGTVLLPLMGVPFGWAKPVPCNPLRFRPGVSMRFGMCLVAAAGPISNICIAAVSFFLLKLLQMPVLEQFAESLRPLFVMLMVLLPINVALCVFNLFPVPPLDGSKIVDGLLPESARPAWNQYCSLGFFPLMVLILMPHIINFDPIGLALNAVMNLVLGWL